MRVARVELREFRNWERASVELPDGLTVISGPNGAGKTNLLEAVYFGCTGRSPRTSNERELVRRGGSVARVELDLADEDGVHTLEVGFEPGEPKRIALDGSPLDGPPGLDARPPVSVFLPERLELVKGSPRLPPGPPRPARGRALAGTRRHTRGLLARPRAAERPARPYARGRHPSTRSAPGTAELARQGIELMRGPPRGGGRPARGLRRARRAPRTARARPSCATAHARRPSRRRSSRPSSPSGEPPTSSAASPSTARTATSSSCCSTESRCAPTGPRASSAWPCWRSCSPSARCSPSAAAGRP